MNEVFKKVREIVEKNNVLRVKYPMLDIEFKKENDNSLTCVIHEQTFDVKSLQKTVIAEHEGFTLNTILKPEIDVDKLVVLGLVDTQLSDKKLPISFNSKDFNVQIDVNDYITKSLICINKFVAEQTKSAFELVIKNTVNRLLDKPYFHICKVCGKDVEEGIDMCDECKAKYIPCSSCGEYHFKDDLYELKGNFYCENCLRKDTKSTRKLSYSTKPDPIFYGEKNNNGITRYYGVEIEVERDRNKAKLSEETIIDIVKKYSEYSYFKPDGSLSNGFEWVTHPCTLDFHKENTSPLLPILEKLGYGTSSGNCGLHIHVGKNVFGEKNVRKYAIGRFLYLEDYFKTSFKAVAKRQKFGYCKDLEKPTSSNLEDAKEYIESFEKHQSSIYNLGIPSSSSGKSINIDVKAFAYYLRGIESDRYHAVNLNNGATLEFRLPQGTMSKNNFIAYLQLIDVMIDIANNFELDFTKHTFIDLFKGKHQELDKLLDETL